MAVLVFAGVVAGVFAGGGVGWFVGVYWAVTHPEEMSWAVEDERRHREKLGR